VLDLRDDRAELVGEGTAAVGAKELAGSIRCALRLTSGKKSLCFDETGGASEATLGELLTVLAHESESGRRLPVQERTTRAVEKLGFTTEPVRLGGGGDRLALGRSVWRGVRSRRVGDDWCDGLALDLRRYRHLTVAQLANG